MTFTKYNVLEYRSKAKTADRVLVAVDCRSNQSSAKSVRLALNESGLSVEDSTKILYHSTNYTIADSIKNSVPGNSLMIHVATPASSKLWYLTMRRNPYVMQ